MSLSKVYRGQEFSELESFQFRSFSEKKPGGATGDKPALAVSGGSQNHQHEVNEAFNRGRQEAVSGNEAKLDNCLQAMVKALDEVNKLREKVARNSSQDMLRMVMAISEQVILQAVEAKPEIVLSIIENALSTSVQADAYRIRVSPQDLDLVNEQKPLFLASISGMKNISISADAAITPGGCRVESDFGDVDATISSQLEEIRKALSGTIVGAE